MLESVPKGNAKRLSRPVRSPGTRKYKQLISVGAASSGRNRLRCLAPIEGVVLTYSYLKFVDVLFHCALFY